MVAGTLPRLWVVMMLTERSVVGSEAGVVVTEVDGDSRGTSGYMKMLFVT